MPKFILVSGENGSGKSLFAEKTAQNFAKKRYYIATMRPVTEENLLRIEKHRLQRAKLSFETLELPCNITEKAIDADSLVLLEDVSNLLANIFFEEGKGADEVFAQMIALCKSCDVLIAVTVSGFEYGGDDEKTLQYISMLKSLNRRLFEYSTVSVFMQNGIPIFEKGDESDLY